MIVLREREGEWNRRRGRSCRGCVKHWEEVLGGGRPRLAWCILVVARVDELKCIARYLKCINSAIKGERRTWGEGQRERDIDK